MRMPTTDVVIETARLRLRRVTLDDAGFILRLVNEPSFLRYIGDKGVRNLEDARNYLLNGPLAMYEKHGFALCIAETKEDQIPIGICGLLKRDILDDVDVGYALLPEFCGMGYAREAAGATVDWARDAAGLKKVVALVNHDNERSIALLEKLGFIFERMFRMEENAPEVKLYTRDL